MKFGHEKPPSTNKKEGFESQQEKEDREVLREELFTKEIHDRLADDFEEAIDDAEIFDEKEEYDAFFNAIVSLPNEERKGVFALPLEIRKRRLNALAQQGLSPEEIVERLNQHAKERGYTLGYHVSSKEIPPEQTKEGVEWRIKGTELDDRDDMPMAYYSLDYTNLFRKKRAEHLYVVRAETGEGTAHKTDQSNNWGRAPELSVVAHFDVDEIEKGVAEREQEYIDKKGSADNEVNGS